MTRGRHAVVAMTLGSVILMASAADAQTAARGIFFRLGETLVTDLSPAGDVDTYVFYGVQGARISLSLSGTSSGFSPTMDLLGANGSSLGAPIEVKHGKLKLKGFSLPATGPAVFGDFQSQYQHCQKNNKYHHHYSTRFSMRLLLLYRLLFWHHLL